MSYNVYINIIHKIRLFCGDRDIDIEFSQPDINKIEISFFGKSYDVIFNKKNELCFCLSTHTAKSRKDINDLKKILPIMLTSANNLKKVLFKD